MCRRFLFVQHFAIGNKFLKRVRPLLVPRTAVWEAMGAAGRTRGDSESDFVTNLGMLLGPQFDGFLGIEGSNSVLAL